jgi:hypothetical protein
MESSDRKVWPWVPLSPEPRTAVLTKASSNFPETRNRRLYQQKKLLQETPNSKIFCLFQALTRMPPVSISERNNSVLYYLCAESTATRPITDTAQCTYK